MKKKAPEPSPLRVKCERARKVVAEIERLTAERKAFYAEHDELVKELRSQPGLEEFGVRLTSPFAKGNTQWGHGPVREYVLEAVEVENKASGLAPMPKDEPRPRARGKA